MVLGRLISPARQTSYRGLAVGFGQEGIGCRHVCPLHSRGLIWGGSGLSGGPSFEFGVRKPSSCLEQPLKMH